MVDDDVDWSAGRQRVVARARLTIDDGQGVVGGRIQCLGCEQRDPEGFHHGAVLGAAHDAAQRQGGLDGQGVLDHALEPERRSQGVGIRVVVHVDEEALPASQTRQRRSEGEIKHV